MNLIYFLGGSRIGVCKNILILVDSSVLCYVVFSKLEALLVYKAEQLNQSLSEARATVSMFDEKL